MTIKDLLLELDAEVKTIVSSDFQIEVTETDYVPSFDDPNITYDNLDSNRKKCKLLESCVLYVDIRGSAQISASKQPKTLAKMYSAFVRTMIACARHFGGHVRNIIGDRVMVVFDRADCFKKATDTAILMNTVSQYILNKRIVSIDFKCGVGIDFGKMLVTKSGAIRHGAEKEFYRSLVWLGRPANTASRLTDLAFKTESWQTPTVRQGLHYPLTNQWIWLDKTQEAFIDSLVPTFSRSLLHKEEYFNTFYTTVENHSRSHPPILMTESVVRGLESTHPDLDYVKQKLFKKKDLQVRDFDGSVFGGDVTFTVGKEL